MAPAPNLVRPTAILAGLLLLLGASAAGAVVLDGNNRITVKLSDGTDVVLYGEYVSKIAPPPPVNLRRAVSRAALLKKKRPTRLNRKQSAAEEASVERDKAAQRAQALRQGHAKPGFSQAQKSSDYYYLPPGNSLHLSSRPDGTPEFLFVKYTTEERADAGGIQGGLMHFLMEWSLTPEQEKELRDKLRRQYKGNLKGAVEMDEDGDKGSFRIVSATLSDQGLTRSLIQSGHAPTMPGGKVAAASNLSKHGAQLFLATVEKSRSIADLSVELDYSYVVQMPAAKGRVVFHWDRMREKQETASKTYTKELEGAYECPDLGDWLCYFAAMDNANRYTYDEREVRGMFDTLVEEGIVQLDFEGYQPDSPYTGQVLEAMLQYFTNSLMQPASEDVQLPEDDGARAEVPEFDRNSRSYTFNYDNLSSAYAVKEQEVSLDAGFGVRQRHQVVGNLASWYDSVKDNEACVQTVNLNDPFFEHREIRFILDLDAKEIFEDMVNYVTVNVRKKRRTSTNFERSLTIDQAYLREKGVAASLTYAREGDKDSELYEYQTQWSIKGGNLYPAHPRWRKGQWEGVTLATPIERWNIEVEGDPDEMQASDLSRVTVEIHYPLFKKEQYEVIPLSARGEALVARNIFVDRGTRGFAYRLILHHKQEGRMVLPWQTRVGDRYVYAAIPPEVLEDGGVAREHAKAAAKKLGEMGAEKVLDQFNELFGDAD